MNLSEEVDLEDYVGRPDKISNAEISAICQEAGMHAVRKNRYEQSRVLHGKLNPAGSACQMKLPSCSMLGGHNVDVL